MNYFRPVIRRREIRIQLQFFMIRKFPKFAVKFAWEIFTHLSPNENILAVPTGILKFQVSLIFPNLLELEETFPSPFQTDTSRQEDIRTLKFLTLLDVKK